MYTYVMSMRMFKDLCKNGGFKNGHEIVDYINNVFGLRGECVGIEVRG